VLAFRRGLAALILSSVTIAVARADSAGFPWQQVGASTYASTCLACHQANGEGVPDSFPPLAGHTPELLAAPGGRDYLVRLALFGLQGTIMVNGRPFNGAMPAWGELLSDAQLAGALNFVLQSWGNDKALPPEFQPITPADIASARATKMSPEAVYALRGRIVPQGASAAPETLAPVIFTLEQADRGHASYRRYCQDCHGTNLDNGEFGGAPLTGQYFAHHWGTGSVAALYGFIRTKMPPDRPGKLNPQTYADLTAFLLGRNGYPAADKELPPDSSAQEHMGMQR
jgi:mono/diheme cytochrome c family protein